MSAITVTVNGEPRAARRSINRTSLLDLLREHLGLTGSKKGCDHGQCGACTVLIDGRRANACLALAVAYDGAEITTVEGLARRRRACTRCSRRSSSTTRSSAATARPGQLCSAVGMLAEAAARARSPRTSTADPPLTPGEIRERMSGNLCRCGAYVNIVAGDRATARRRR